MSQMIQSGKKVVLFADYSKVYNIVNHSIILKQIRGMTEEKSYNLIKQYLKKQNVKILNQNYATATGMP